MPLYYEDEKNSLTEWCQIVTGDGLVKRSGQEAPFSCEARRRIRTVLWEGAARRLFATTSALAPE